MGVIKNLCGINWVIEPLGAEIVPVYPVPCVDPPDPVPLYPEQDVPALKRPMRKSSKIGDALTCDPSVCGDTAFRIRPDQGLAGGLRFWRCLRDLVPLPKVPAYWDRGCDRPAGLPDRVWPGVLAAECIVRSMMPPTCPSSIIARSCS